MKKSDRATSSDEFKERVRDATDLADLIGQSSKLSGQPRDLRGRCPLHNGGNPTSLSVNAENGLWQCKSCDSRGDCFSWVMAVHEVEFPEALRILADRAGLRPDPDAKPVAPPEDPLEQLAEIRGWDPDALRALGAHSEEGRDGRRLVALPMRDAGGSTVGWRERGADNLPLPVGRGKTAKSKTRKSTSLGLFYQSDLSELPDPLLIVEGEADAVAAISAGHRATIGTAGATASRDSLRWLQELASGRDVVIAPDPDAAGRGWRDRLAKLLGNAGCIVRLIVPEGDRDLDDRLRAADNPPAELARLIEQSRPYEPSDGDPDTSLPEVVTTNRHLREVSDEALQALQLANDPPTCFVRSGRIVRVRADEHGRPLVEDVETYALRGLLARAANFVRLSNDTSTPTAPPMDLTRDIASRGEWPLPALVGVVEVPVLRPDGTLISEPGYDPDTALLYRPAPDLNVPLVPDRPTPDQVANARSLLLDELFRDFPFADQASRANTLALMLTPVVRSIIDGPVPLALIDAPQQGTGKTLVTEVISTVVTGREAALMSAPETEDEWRKRLTSLLLEGATVINIDNVIKPLDSASLAAAITARTYSDRVLGESRTLNLPVRCTWTATGNNIVVRGDLPRRCYWIRLDAKRARPWQRSTDEFAHPLPAWAHEARGELLAALLTLCRAWAEGGQLSHDASASFGSFESWQRTVGGILDAVGVEGFLDNIDAFHDTTDADQQEWYAFLSVWHDALPDHPITVNDLCSASNIIEQCPAEARDPDGTVNNRRLGNALRSKNGMRFDEHGLRVEDTGQKSQRSVLWCVRADRKDNQDASATENGDPYASELSELSEFSATDVRAGVDACARE